MEITVSVPGKIFLMGEHAVVYGKPALLSTINKRVLVKIKESQKSNISSLDDKFLKQILKIVIKYYKIKKLPHFELTVSSQLKSGYHLGSSAAVAVATIAALLFFLKKIWNPQLVNKLAYEVEKIKHGTPSGADNSAITFGGFIWYRRELDFLKNIWQIPLEFTQDLDRFYLVDTGPSSETTLEMVNNVRKNYEKDKQLFNELFNKNELAVRNLALALKNKDEERLISSLIAGENTLEKMLVVSPKVIPFIRMVEDAGGAAKILGGGGMTAGVGFLLCYGLNEELLNKISLKFNYRFERVKVGEEGLRLEKGSEF